MKSRTNRWQRRVTRTKNQDIHIQIQSNDLKGGFWRPKRQAKENQILHTKSQIRDAYGVNKKSLGWTGQTLKELQLCNCLFHNGMFAAVRAQFQQFDLVSHTVDFGAKIHSVASSNFNTHVSSYIFTEQVGMAAILQTYIRFETQPRYIPSSAKFQWSLSTSPGKHRDCTAIKPRQLPVQSFISSSSH